ncbi:hypothetical protein GCM10009001_27310 [Virgibacillus siamensis]|uniref:ABC-2 family transporter protein n=1 Tax=Virgibacillus siamensis TaxID=480071 RepID=A0ABP3RJQ6_9BACI
MLEYKYCTKKMMFFSIGYTLVIAILSTVYAANGFSNSLFDYIVNLRSGGSMNVITFYVGVLPTLAILLPILMDRMENDFIISRIKEKNKLLNQHIIFAAIISVIIIVLLAMTGIIGSFVAVGHIHNLWPTEQGMVYLILENKMHFPLYVNHVTSVKVWSYLLTSRFLVTVIIAFIIIFLKTILRNNMYVFFVSQMFFWIDSFLPKGFSLFTGKIRTGLDTWLSLQEQLFNFVYLILVIVILYLVCRRLYKTKEFYHKIN